MKDYEIYYKDARNITEVGDRTVQLVVTSPPYWNLYNYGHQNEIGFTESYDKYIKSLEQVWEECYRVLKSDGTIWINISNKTYKGTYYDIAGDICASMKKLGFIQQNIIIWHKPNAMPIHNKKNFTNKFEFVLFFSKSQDYKFNKDDVRVSQKYAQIDWGKRYEKYNKNGKDPGNVWVFSPKKGNLSKKLNHPAPFPVMIPHFAILGGTDEDDVVLDPFLGSGTTLKVCKQLKRKCIGYEINTKFKDLIDEKIFLTKLSDYIR